MVEHDFILVLTYKVIDLNMTRNRLISSSLILLMFQVCTQDCVQINQQVDRSLESKPQDFYSQNINLNNNVNEAVSTNNTTKSRFKHLSRPSHLTAINSKTSHVRNLRSLNNSVDTFIKELFKTFGSSDNKVDIVGFEKMMKHLGLTDLFENTFKGSEVSHSHHHEQNDTHELIERGGECLLPKQAVDQLLEKNSPVLDDRSESVNSTTVNNVTNQLGTQDFQMNKNDIVDICPVLLYHMLKPEVCGRKHEHDHHGKVNIVRGLTWLYSSLSILIVSLCGLLGVFVIPFMDKKFYHHLLQFLVALAVGTLCGDALLHLLPHAMVPHHSHDHNTDHSNHSAVMWKGLAALAGLVTFFFTEKILYVIAEWRKKKQRENKVQNQLKSVEIMKSNGKENSSTGEKTCKHTYSLYPYCYDDIKNNKDGHGKDAHFPSHEHRDVPETSRQHEHHTNSTSGHSHVSPRYSDDVLDVEESVALTEDQEPKTNDVSKVESEERVVSETVFEDNHVKEVNNKKEHAKKEEYTVILREHESSHHGHSHTHGHVHSPPQSMSSVAWMVILGDGLHNFTDGMTVGAAFANNITGGCSTAIAVFCHELPHELGDFAVLLKAGMSARQAVFYNLLSSILSYVGMCIGMLVGDVPEVSSWVFALAAGMFLYIGLVDMFPELSNSHSDNDILLCQCSLQGLGLLAGISIMLLIAYYEDHLKTLF